MYDIILQIVGVSQTPANTHVTQVGDTNEFQEILSTNILFLKKLIMQPIIGCCVVT